MIGLQVTEKGKITKINKMEICDNADSSKVKITKVMLTPEDFQTILGDDDVKYPIIPGRIAIGQITDASDSAYLQKGTRVSLSSIENCGECVECLAGENEKCVNLKIAGNNKGRKQHRRHCREKHRRISARFRRGRQCDYVRASSLG